MASLFEEDPVGLSTWVIRGSLRGVRVFSPLAFPDDHLYERYILETDLILT